MPFSIQGNTIYSSGGAIVVQLNPSSTDLVIDENGGCIGSNMNEGQVCLVINNICSPCTGGGGGTWGSIGGNLPDQTDLQTALDGKMDENAAITGATKTKITYDAKGLVTAGVDAAIADITGLQTALDAKAASSHTHALSDITQSGATTNQVPKWNGSAWVPANEAGGSDGNGIYSGSGTIPGATEATLEPNGSFRINYDGGNQAILVDDAQGSVNLYDKTGASNFFQGTAETGIDCQALYIGINGDYGNAGQFLGADGLGYITWQTPAGGGASVTQITYADMQTAITNGTLTPGAWYLITDAAGTDLGFLTNAVNENTINVSGVGGYLNADFQAVGDYSGTPETFGTQLGIWRTGFETVTINYLNLAGGTFAVGDTITGGTTGATAVVVSDDGAASMTAYMTSAGVAFDGSEVLDNGGGVTADMDGAASSPTIVQGDCVIWNLLHYQLTDAALLDGNNPATNTAAYTLLDKATYPETYVTAWDVSEFDFPNNWITYRQDILGNLIRGNDGFLAFSWGNEKYTGNLVQDGVIDQKNSIGSIINTVLHPGSEISNNVFSDFAQIYDCEINAGAAIYGNTIGEFGEIGKCIIYHGGEISGNILALSARILQNTVYQNSQLNENILGENTVIGNNILENGAQLTGITAGANCSISRNKIGQGATLGGTTTMDDGAAINDNEMKNAASVNTLSLSDGSQFSYNIIGSGVNVSQNNLVNSGNFNSNTVLSEIFNKTIDGVAVTDCYVNNSWVNTQTITEAIEGRVTDFYISTFIESIDITGFTAVDFTADFSQYVGIFNLTSSNATEAIDTITNPPTLFPFTIRPAAGLSLTITGTAYAGIAAGQIALKATDYTLDGDKGEYIVLEIDPLGTGALIEKQVVNGLL